MVRGGTELQEYRREGADNVIKSSVMEVFPLGLNYVGGVVNNLEQPKSIEDIM